MPQQAFRTGLWTPPLDSGVLVTDLYTPTNTGWRLMIDQKYFLTVTPFWALTIFYAYGGLTRCGPFDKIWLLWSEATSYGHYNHGS